MSLTEAKTRVDININGSIVAVIPAKAVFNALPAEPVGPNQAFDESASCLFTAVNANASGGTVADNDGLEQQVGTTGGGAKCFKDAWGTPIVFVRNVYNPEVANPPFIRAGQPSDPFDQSQNSIGTRGKLTVPTTVWTASSLSTWWNTQRLGAPAFAQVPAAYPGAVNHIPTAISAGSNKNFGTDIYGLTVSDTDTAKDNHVSYRLRREGTRGD